MASKRGLSWPFPACNCHPLDGLCCWERYPKVSFPVPTETPKQFPDGKCLRRVVPAPAEGLVRSPLETAYNQPGVEGSQVSVLKTPLESRSEA